MYIKLNYFRFYLAFSVVVYHVYTDWIPQAGTLAVLGFFFVSGYLISKLLSETYSNRPRQFLANRFLRIYPAYFASALIGCILIALIPDILQATNPALKFPADIKEIIDNIVIFGLSGNSSRIVPPAWSLDIELNWYLIFFVLSFLKLWLRKAFLFVVLILVLFFIFPVKYKFYGDVLGSGYAFCAGALHYYYRPKLNKFISHTCAVMIIPFMYALPHILGTRSGPNDDSLNWLMLTSFVLLLFISFQFFISDSNPNKKMKEDGTPSFTAKLSRILGSVSYPMFLTHWYASGVTYYLLGAPKNTAINLVGTLILTLLISFLIVFAIENPLLKIRQTIRESR
jgi:peptidoglycan/LPS O-acetylase OafA/YrhL